jgi:hypothetical protein
MARPFFIGGKVRILPNQAFLHEKDRYEPGQVYQVEDAQGFYFCAVGWASAVDTDYVPVAEEQPSEVDLDVHNASLNIKDSNG